MAMLTDLHYLLLSTLLTWLMLIVASLLRSQGWTSGGMRLAFGNRDDLPEPSPVTARSERAARNMLENLPLLIAVLVAARFAGADLAALSRGAAIFFWARLAYFFIYLAGIPVLRTLAWMVSLIGLALIAAAAW